MNTNSKCIFPSDVQELGNLMLGMKAAYLRGENAMEYARHTINNLNNSSIATLISYDLQAGSYVKVAKVDPDARIRWCKQLASILDPYITNQNTMLEVGSGEATTLAGVLTYLRSAPKQAFGFDISWSRCAYGLNWLKENKVTAQLFVADLFDIPLQDSSIDVVYSSHSLEPNGGKEKEAIQELVRIARKEVVLFEPIYELANSEAQVRMNAHGYIRGLKSTIEELGLKVTEYKLLPYSGNPLNPSGVLVIEIPKRESEVKAGSHWRCPITKVSLDESFLGFYSSIAGIVYPILAGIPLLRSTHAVVASSFEILTKSSNTVEK